MSFCTKCGAPMTEDARFCTTCGAPAAESAPEEPAPQPVAVEPAPTRAATPTPVATPRGHRALWVVAAVALVVLALVAAGVLGALAFLVFTPEKAVADLAAAVNAEDAAAAERLLVPALAREFDEADGILPGLEASRVGDSDQLDRTSATFSSAVMVSESEDSRLQLTLRRAGLAWKVESVAFSASETVTEEIEAESQSVETDALPSGTTLVVSEGQPGSRSVTRERTVTNGAISDTVLDETVFEEPEPALEWVGTGSESDYADNVSAPAAGDYVNRSTWIVDDPKDIISADSSEVAASFTIDPITSDMVFGVVFLKPDGTEYRGNDVHPDDPSWTNINVGWWHDDVQTGEWAAILLINGDPAEYVRFTVE